MKKKRFENELCICICKKKIIRFDRGEHSIAQRSQRLEQKERRREKVMQNRQDRFFFSIKNLVNSLCGSVCLAILKLSKDLKIKINKKKRWNIEK